MFEVRAKSMDRLVVSFVLLLGTVALISHGTSSSVVMKDGDAKRREECIRRVTHYLAQIKIDGAVRDIVAYARSNYDTERYANMTIVTHYPDACRELHKQVKHIKVSIPCYYDQTIMGMNEYQNARDVIMENRQAKYVVESEYACFHRIPSGSRLREDGLYETVTGRNWTPELDPWPSTADKIARHTYLSNLAKQRLFGPTDRRTTSILYDYDAKPDDPSRLADWKRRRALFLGSISPRELLVTISASTEYDPSHECPICGDVLGSEPKAAELTNCGHSFHESCLMSWSKTSEEARLESLCPVCRGTFQVCDEWES